MKSAFFLTVKGSLSDAFQHMLQCTKRKRSGCNLKSIFSAPAWVLKELLVRAEKFDKVSCGMYGRSSGSDLWITVAATLLEVGGRT